MLSNKEEQNTKSIKISTLGKLIRKVPAAIKQLINKSETQKNSENINHFSLKENNGFVSYLRKGIVCSLAAAIVTVLGFGTFGSANLCFGSEAIVNGHSIALINDVDKFEDTLSRAQQFANAVSEQEVEFNVTYFPRVMPQSDVTPEDEIIQSLYSQCSGMVQGCALYIEGELVAAAPDMETANLALEELKDQYRDDSIENLVVSFDKDVQLKEEYVPSQMIMSAESIAAVLTGDRTHYGYYTVNKGDTVEKIAEKLNVSESSLEYLKNDSLYSGMVIAYQHQDTLLKVKAEYTQTASVVIPYETERISDSSLKKGVASVKTKGSDGEKLVTTKYVMLNGEETGKQVVEEKIVTPVQNEVIQIGCGEADGKFIVASAEGSTGYFLWPNRGQISSGFGIRARDNHKGIDISSPLGSDIYASDGGTVTFAGWNDGGYGYLVIIDHGNGYVTYYAHCSEVLVNAGDKVSQGDVIALIGSTGISTGPHLHFEVRLNGTPINPLNYLDE